MSSISICRSRNRATRISTPTSHPLCFEEPEVRSSCYEGRSSEWREDAGETPAVRRNGNLAGAILKIDAMCISTPRKHENEARRTAQSRDRDQVKGFGPAEDSFRGRASGALSHLRLRRRSPRFRGRRPRSMGEGAGSEARW